jgi:hypothetical protein
MNRVNHITKAHAFKILDNLKSEYKSIKDNKHYNFEKDLIQLKAIIKLYELSLVSKYPLETIKDS